jgi:hypothetical protein
MWLKYLNSSWFPITMESRCFDVPTLKIMCTFVLGLDDEHPLCVIQLEVELHLLVEDIISSVPRKHVRIYISCGQFSPPFALISEESGYIRYLHSFGTLVACIIWFCDIFITSKCMWQICNVLQIYDWTYRSDFQVREYKDWKSMTFIIYLSAFFVVLISP